MEYSREKYLELMEQKKFNEADEYRISNIPKTLFKFMYISDVPDCKEKCEIESFNDIKINSIENKEFWMSTRDNLNDPFELKSLYIEEEKIKQYNYPLEIIQELIKSYREEVLIGCFTTNLANNMPMWAHYANNHKGFCLEYNIHKPKFFFPISYEGERAPANVVYMNYINLATKSYKKTITDEEIKDFKLYQSLIFHSTIIKHSSWEYENEYRLLFPKSEANRVVHVNKNGGLIPNSVLGIEIKSIYIGMSCNEMYKDKLIGIGKKLGINVYEMYFDDISDKFELSYKIIEQKSL
ncbi:DUF2971 domain-containing protein [Clostridium saccharoperbutylacetonicum]|uniref:DUF2971 domain-containing protein n=1 Tax=Clostridium saccharoperbutylacetonicum TaxID=36745 RepID=UPI000983F250|nr:DUF2971 domain-containing protein [Clostridium saccharoperbutylacetonicum]AQR98149.1 hypothetical protein CLSAP_55000 [Clostridium saccharoperbutylacetonicum]NSB34042.1 hypothetical protein [Clostridium saccharoperbutylacetonicum]